MDQEPPVDPARSAMMARVRGRDTRPEIAVRRALHAAGLRFRLQARDLPGRPDVVLRPSKVAIFVHGCFWHRHEGCRHATTPKTRTAFWLDKFKRNVERDARVEARLREAGWHVEVFWECLVKGDPLAERVARIAETVRARRS